MTETLLDPGPAGPGDPNQGQIWAVPTHGQAPAQPIDVAGSRFRWGTSSWADQGLVREGGFYPRKTMNASDRLAYYCSRLPLAEIATTYRFPPTPDMARQWVARTPAGFCLDVRAWSLLTENPTLPDSLWEDLHDQVRPETRHRRRLYSAHLAGDGMEECWRRFAHALRPLRDAGRLGVVILQYPSWFTPKPETRAVLAAARQRLDGFRVAVEFRSPKWLVGSMCEETLEWLEAIDMGFVCVDGPASGRRALPPVVAATSSVAVVRFVGRRADPEDPWTWPYRYSDTELAVAAGRVRELASATEEVHLITDNCWRGDAVDNALTLASLLDAPLLDAPLLDAPLLDAPVMGAPVMGAPVMRAPTFGAPVSPDPRGPGASGH